MEIYSDIKSFEISKAENSMLKFNNNIILLL